MPSSPFHFSRSRPSPALAAAALAAFVFGGCVCREDDWVTFVDWDGGTVDESSHDCSYKGLERRSKIAAELAGSADPKLLAEARREAERECRERASKVATHAALK